MNNHMQNDTHRIANYPHWDQVCDYESDEAEVTLLDTDGRELISYDYCQFMIEDFKRFKKIA